MRTYLTIYVPELDILKTINREITNIDTNSFFEERNKKYYKIEPYIYTSDGSIATLISEKELNNSKYESQVINDCEHMNCLLEGDFNIFYPCLNNIAIIVSYIGDCEEYIGEKIAIERMQAYSENLKVMCLKKLENL